MSRDAKTNFVKSLVDNKIDPHLGFKVYNHLKSKGLETWNESTYQPAVAFKHLEEAIYTAYKSLGLDVDNDDSIKDTPKRFAKMFVGELTKGLNYNFFPKCTATSNGNVLAEEGPETRSIVSSDDDGFTVKGVEGNYDQAVIVKRIRTTSLCEHHLQTIDGFTHIAYIPNTKVLGLSKFARVTEFFAARPQIQERMTEQIYEALSFILETADVAVVQDAVHFCMRARGCKQPESWTQTNKMGGRFLTNPELRREFLDAIQ
jgi:GTP cyclohydrolase IA